MTNDGKTIKSRPKEFFLHLLSVVTLYISAGSFIALLFQFWNYLLPDFAQDPYSANAWLWPMRTAVASLIVVFPVFAGLSIYLDKLYKKEPDLRDLRVRRWLLNFTLFVAALVIICDFIALIYNFISGELALRFILKAATILVTAGIIFGYYFIDLKNDPKESGLVSNKTKNWIGYFALAAVILPTIFSFFIIGSPFEARDRNIDEIRVQNLENIKWRVIDFWQAKGRLPESLEEIKDPTRGVLVPVDPETGSPYEYKITGENLFELCADFNTSNILNSTTKETPAIPAPVSTAYPRAHESLENSIWSHDSGYVCFSRFIDKDYFQPQPFKD